MKLSQHLKNIFILLSILLGISEGAHAQSMYLRLRIDSLIYSALKSENSQVKLEQFEAKYPLVADWLAFGVLDPSSELEALPTIERVYKHPALWSIYTDVERQYSPDSLDSLFSKLGQGVDRLREAAPELRMPDTLATHVSGLQQSIIVTPGLVSIALDKYLGSSYSIYADYFSEYQRQSMNSQQIVRDALFGWIVSEKPKAREEVYTLRKELDYWGEIYLLLAKTLPSLNEAELFGFTTPQLIWLRKNEKNLVENANKRGEFDSPSPAISERYFRELGPDELLPPEAPRLIGHWLGWRLKGGKISKTK